MWLQTPLVCCTVDHMFTLKRISGVSPSGAEINVNSWVQIFLSPRCWKAQSQSRGLGQLLWADQLSWASRMQGLSGTEQHMQGTEDRQCHSHSLSTHPQHWKPDGWCLQLLCVFTHKNYYVTVSNHEVLLHKVTLNVYFFFFFSLTKSLQRLVDEVFFLLWKESFKTLFTLQTVHTCFGKGKNTSPSQSLSIWPGVVLKQPGITLCFYRKVFWMLCSFPYSVRDILDIQLRVNVCKMGASQPSNSLVVLWICPVKWKRCWPMSFSLKQSSWESKNLLSWRANPFLHVLFPF